MRTSSALYEDQNKILEHFDLTRQSSSAGPQMCWKIYDAYRKQDKQECSVFVFEKKIAEKLHKPKRREAVCEMLRRSVKELEKYRHSNSRILQLIHPLEESNHTLAFASERILASLANLLGNHDRLPSPLPHAIEDYDFLDIEVKYGILQLTEALCFLHNTEQVMHNDVSPQSIFVTKKGTWKLGGLGFLETTKDHAKYIYICVPWTSKSPKMCQPDLDYMAPEIQTKRTCTSAADVFSLGMVIATLHNDGKSLIDAQHQPHTYLKKVEQLKEAVEVVLPVLPRPLQTPVSKMLSRNDQNRPTGQAFISIKYFNDSSLTCLQYLDVVDQKDTQQKCDFYQQLPNTLHLIPKKLVFQHVLPTLQSEIKVYDVMGSVLVPIISIMESSTQEEFCDYIRPCIWAVFALPKSVSAWQVVLSSLDIILRFVGQLEIQSEVVPLVVTALDHVSPQVQDSALSALSKVQRFLDEETLKKKVLPRAKQAYIKGNSLKSKITALCCLDKLLDSLDKMTILDEVVPFIAEIQAQDSDIIMAVCGIYNHMMSSKKFGLTHQLVATKVMPPLLPLVVCPSLNAEQFETMMELLRDMLDNIDVSHRAKLKMTTTAETNFLSINDSDRPSHLRHRRSMTDAPIIHVQGEGQPQEPPAVNGTSATNLANVTVIIGDGDEPTSNSLGPRARWRLGGLKLQVASAFKLQKRHSETDIGSGTKTTSSLWPPQMLMRHRHSTTELPTIKVEDGSEDYDVDKESLLPPGLSQLMNKSNRNSVVDSNWLKPQGDRMKEKRHSLIDGQNIRDLFGSLTQTPKEAAREEKKAALYAKYGFDSTKAAANTGSTLSPKSPRSRRSSCVSGISSPAAAQLGRKPSATNLASSVGTQMMNFLKK